MKRYKVIAEIGCNHKGDLDIAEEMIKIAAQFCYADVVKFQKRNNRELLTKVEYDAPHPVPRNARICSPWRIGYLSRGWPDLKKPACTRRAPRSLWRFIC